MLKQIILVFVALLVVASATEVNECGTGEPFPDSNQVNITGCDVSVCKLKRGTQPSFQARFTPNHDVETVKNSVSAAVLTVPLPFIGVDGTSACESIFNLDGTPAGCSLKKGVEYVYKRRFPILDVYPQISMVIHYALKSESDTLLCFEVPAKITKN